MNPAVRRPVESYHVESHYVSRVSRACTQKYLGRADDFCLLPHVNRQRRVAYSIGSAVSHLYEHQALPVLHDEIDLAKAAVEVTPEAMQAATLQVEQSAAFGMPA